MAFTTSQKTTDGREYVAVFGDPNRSTPTDRYVYKPDGTLESEWHDHPTENFTPTTAPFRNG